METLEIRCEICSKLTKISKWLYWHGNIQKHWWRSDVFIFHFEQIPHLLLVFHYWIWESVAGWVYQRRTKGRRTNYARTGKKLCNINQTSQTTTWKNHVSNLKSLQSESFEQISMKCIEFSFHKSNFLVGNKIVLQTSSEAMTDTSSVHCFDQYLTYDALRDLKQFIQFKI